MPETLAKVMRIQAGDVQVCLAPPTACAGCTGLCAAGLFSRFSAGGRVWKLPVPAGVSLRAGDVVSVYYDAHALAWSLLVACGLPMTGLLIGALAGFFMRWPVPDLAGALGMAGGLLAGTLAARAAVRHGGLESRIRILAGDGV